ncbi:MAG: hypothetical protein UY21_C0009G0057 [Microgenomates group bacterium GW2011_GWA1_48_10]|nr:MAG: hypothetical protein UY21_C0009G0057 [Microgenomates group bacterium GW2011_GWA1_48_10]
MDGNERLPRRVFLKLVEQGLKVGGSVTVMPNLAEQLIGSASRPVDAGAEWCDATGRNLGKPWEPNGLAYSPEVNKFLADNVNIVGFPGGDGKAAQMRKRERSGIMGVAFSGEEDPTWRDFRLDLFMREHAVLECARVKNLSGGATVMVRTSRPQPVEFSSADEAVAIATLLIVDTRVRGGWVPTREIKSRGLSGGFVLTLAAMFQHSATEMGGLVPSKDLRTKKGEPGADEWLNFLQTLRDSMELKSNALNNIVSPPPPARVPRDFEREANLVLQFSVGGSLNYPVFNNIAGALLIYDEKLGTS